MRQYTGFEVLRPSTLRILMVSYEVCWVGALLISESCFSIL
jgi:hypothetical protein